MVHVISKVRTIVSGLKVAKKVSVSLGSIRLALENPEDLRGELLKKIRAHIESSAKLLFDSPDYVISGLDEPIRVRQKGEREIEVFLPFRVTYAQRK